MTHVRRTVCRFASLCVLSIFAVASIGGDGCFGDWGTASPPKSAATPQSNCCEYPGDEYYTCAIQVLLTDASIGDSTGAMETRCFVTNPACSSTTAAAQKSATTLATATYWKPGQQTVQIQTIDCKPVGACIKGGLTPLDYPGACTMIVEMDAGSCAANTETCSANTDCCSAICSESGSCEACRGDLEGCVNDSDCCSGTCSLNACGGAAGTGGSSP